MKKILMVLAPRDFRDSEYIVPRSFFEQKGYTVITTSLQSKSVGRFGYEVKNDLLLDAVVSKNFDSIFFVGGGGSLGFMGNNVMINLTKSFIKEGKVIGAICAAPRNLLVWGVLRGERVTGHNWDGNFPKLCKENGAIYEDREVVVSGNFVTGRGPKAAEEFSLAFVDTMS